MGEYKIDESGDSVKMMLCGQINESEQVKIREVLWSILSRNSIKNLELNLKMVPVLDGGAISFFITINNSMKKNGGMLVLKEVSPAGVSMLKDMRLLNYFNL